MNIIQIYDKDFMRISSVVDSVEKIHLFLKIFELESSHLRSTVKGGEPMLGKRELYPTVNSSLTRKMSDDGKFDEREHLNLMLNVVSLIDSKHRLSDIANKLDEPLSRVVHMIEELIEKGLIVS
jgi:aminopeptidase-like protein